MRAIKIMFMVVLGLFVAGMKYRQPPVGDKTNPAGLVNQDEDDVDSPADVSKSGWKEAFRRTKQALKDKNITTTAAGLAYYATLTFFPAVLGLATVYASFAGTEALQDSIAGLQYFVPAVIYDIFQTQLSPLTQAGTSSLGIAAVVSVAAVLWTTSGGLQNLVTATNLAYEVKETRNLIKLRLTSIVLSIILLVLGAAIVVLLLLQADSLTRLGFPQTVATVFPFVRWALLIGLLSVGLSVIYRYAPDRTKPKWAWVSWGATAATIIWLVATVVFFYYTRHFGDFNKSYGTFAGIIIMMIWFYASSLIILVGAQVNKKLEEVTDAETAVQK